MIPLYVGATAGGSKGLPSKNPIYFIRKAVGRLPTLYYSVAVLNTEENVTNADHLPTGMFFQGSPQLNGYFDVESLHIQDVYDQHMVPLPTTDGSLVGPPSKNHSVITIKGFIRADDHDTIVGNAWFLNQQFNPVRNYLEGASFLEDTILPHWEPFFNIGYGMLAWFDPSSKNDWRADSDWQDMVTDPYDLEPYARLNRFMFVRSVRKPVEDFSKFDDFSAPFTIQLIAADPTVYEFITPSLFFDGTADQVTIDESKNGQFITNPTAGASVSNEEFVRPTDIMWGHDGPGYREVTSEEFNDLLMTTASGDLVGLSLQAAEGDALVVAVTSTWVAGSDADSVTVTWYPHYVNSGNTGTGYPLTRLHESSVSDTQRVIFFGLNGVVASTQANARINTQLTGQSFGGGVMARVIEGGVASITPSSTGTGSGTGTSATAAATVNSGDLLFMSVVIHSGNNSPPAVTPTNLPVTIDAFTNQVFSQMRHFMGYGVSGSPSVAWTGSYSWKAASIVIAGAA